MIPNRPLPISGVWETPDVYTEALLSFATTSVLFMNLCGGVHMVDFLTREPDVYTTTLPEKWREFFQHHDVQDIIHLLLREEIGPLRAATNPVEETSRTWRGGAFPPQSLLDYIFNVRQLALLRDLDTSSASQTELPSQVVMRMNRKKVHEVRHFSQYVASLSQTVYERRGEPPPYHKHIIAIERKHEYISGARTMDVRAKLAKDPKAYDPQKQKDSCDCQNDTPELIATAATNVSPPILQDLQITEDVSNLEVLGDISLSPDGYLEPVIDHIIHPESNDGETKKERDARLMVVSLHSCGNLVHHGIRSLILNSSIVAVAMIGCCYNLLTERLGPSEHELPVLQSLHPRLKEAGSSYDPHGFPMSQYYENYRSPGATTGMKLNITARALAVQAPYNWSQKDSETSFTRHFFRALLQRILVDRNVIPKPSAENDALYEATHPKHKGDSIIIGGVSKGAYKTFNAYVRAATIKMSCDPNYGSKVQQHIATLTDEEIDGYETNYLYARKHMSIMWSLMGFSAQLVESIIVVDRWQFLREQDSVKDCWVEPVFEYGQSPRNLAVIGLKK
ncbi:hypothetical protein N7452_008380 [Penicillium brevicompactum]|uniref:Methyltransferase domain-containing protein n=1 Tax=Penicillium brevicompactum TaxID=5074 RepID=A0A9W9Q6S0_PENBR|nr:hypothetical protein N7452_008380 [Penicillium brevicompactum]